MSAVRSSLAYSLASSYVALPLQLAGTMIISRLLTPQETGIFAVAAVFAALASTFRDLGVAEYLIQEKQLDATKIRAALTLNIAASWAVGLLLFFAAPFAARFYGTPGVADVMQVQAFNFALIPFGAVTMAHFRRELNFRPIFVSGLLANLTSWSVAIVCAWQGLAYMSLAWSSLAGVVVTVGTMVWFRPREFPRWPGLKGLAEVFHFGKFASSIYIFEQLGRGAPEMIIGRAHGMADVGLFSRASGLVELFNRTVLRAVMPVCMPYFAQGHREQGSVVNGYLRSMSLLTAIGWPFLALMAVTAYAAIRIVYGTQWIASVPLAQILCVAGSVELVHYLAKEALIAAGEVKRSNTLQMGLQVSRVLGVLAVIPFGIAGACWGLLAAAIIGFGLSQQMLSRATALKTTDVVTTCLPSLWLAIGSVAPIAIWTTFQPITESNFIFTAFGAGSATVVAWLIGLRLLRHPLWSELQTVANRLIGKPRHHRSSDDRADLNLAEVIAASLATHYGGVRVNLGPPVSLRWNSRVFSATVDGTLILRIAVKCCLDHRSSQPDHLAASLQFEALKKVRAALSTADPRYGVPEPLFLDPALAMYAMNWIGGPTLSQRMRRVPSAARIVPLFESAGAWLGSFHRLGPLRNGPFDVAPRQASLRRMMTTPVAHRAFASAADALLAAEPSVDDRPVHLSWLHGDCKADNFMFSEGNTYAIDVVLSHENAIEHDLAQFMNHLDTLLAHPRYLHLLVRRRVLHDAFRRGYRATGPEVSEPCLHWLRLWGLLTLWHTTAEEGRESRLRGWLLNRMFAAMARRLTKEVRALTAAGYEPGNLTRANDLH